MNELALFAGAGGGLLGTKLLGWRTVCYVEWEKYPVEVLKARIRDGCLDDAPIWDDAFTFDGRPWAGLVDVITAGFPCQPFSIAGKGLAENDPRNGWPATIRIIREVRPRYLLLENVPALLSKRYFGTILGELSESGYCVRWDCIPASSVVANHQRDRLWIVAHAEGKQGNVGHQPQGGEGLYAGWNGTSQHVADAPCIGLQGIREDGNASGSAGLRSGERCYEKQDVSHTMRKRSQEQKNVHTRSMFTTGSWWQAEPDVGRVANGVAARVDRLRAIGNGQVPAVVRAAWRLLGEG